MLALSRRSGEWIRIGDDIELHVLSTGTGKVRLGIRAPRKVHILRGELLAARHLGGDTPGSDRHGTGRPQGGKKDELRG